MWNVLAQAAEDEADLTVEVAESCADLGPVCDTRECREADDSGEDDHRQRLLIDHRRALLGLAYGGIALALGAATGRTRIAAFGTVGLALVAFLANGLLPFSENLSGLVEWQPFYYYLGSNPLMNGMDWGHGAVLSALFAVLLGLSVLLFNRRDLRQTG